MPLPQTVLRYSYIHHAEETTRATLSNEYNTFNTFINVNISLSLKNKFGKKFSCPTKKSEN